MATDPQTTANTALDGFEDYYTEKLWSWLPGYHRDEDAKTDTPGTLRSIVEAMGAESADVRRALDRMWENHFVELADDAALAQLGELVATRMVHALNRRGRRVDVAKTIAHRRRKGTPRLLESLATDIAGWLGAHLEARRRLARSVHLLEPGPNRTAIFTGTPRGGWADLRSPRIPALAWTAFEELAHTPDFRPRSGTRGRYNIQRVQLHVHRMRAFEINYPTVVLLGGTPGIGEPWKYSLDPSGRAVSLFQVADRPSGDAWVRQREWQMPKAIECRLLAHTEFEWSKATLASLSGTLLSSTIDLLMLYVDRRVRSVRALRRLFASFPAPEAADLDTNIVAVMQATLVSGCGRAQLYGPDPDVGGNQALTLAIGTDNTAAALAREAVQAGNLSGWGSTWDLTAVLDAADPTQQAIVDPGRGAVISQATDAVTPVIAPVLHVGGPGEVGANGYDRRDTIETTGVTALGNGGDAVGPIATTLAVTGVEELVDSKTYDVTVDLVDVEDYTLQAANFQRPYLRYTEATVGPALTTWTITAKAKAQSTDVRCLTFEGLWIGLHDTNAVPEIVGAGNPCTPVDGRLVLAGTWDRVVIRHCTLDPGGEKLRVDEAECEAIQTITLEIAGYVEELVIERSMVGPILGTVAGDACSIGKLIVRDSVVHSPSPGSVDAIDVEFGEVHIERSSIVGDVTANRLYASDSWIAGTGTIADVQHGCFRFSAAASGSTWPKPYASTFYPNFELIWFESITYGDASYMRLSEAAPAELLTGAENHGELGVWNHLIEPILRADLRAKLREFMPFDLQLALVTDN